MENEALKCEICGKPMQNPDEIVEFRVFAGNETEPFAVAKLCSGCAKPLEKFSEEELSKLLSNTLNDLSTNWELGTKDNTKVGDIIRIISLKGEDDHSYLWKTGVVDHIDDIGQLHGTWGGLAVIPGTDSYLVFKGE